MSVHLQLISSLNRLPGGLARFIPCQPSAHYARSVHVGWTRCGHGLSSRPPESCDTQLMHPLLSFFGYPDGAASELYHGRPKLRGISTLLLQEDSYLAADFQHQ